jgi:hypothetical protein
LIKKRKICRCDVGKPLDKTYLCGGVRGGCIKFLLLPVMGFV